MAIDIEAEADELRDLLAKRGWTHLRVTKRGKALTIVSGPEDDPEAEIRLTHEGRAGWRLDIANHTGRWEPTPFSGDLAEMVDTAASMGRLEDYGSGPWTPGGTSDPSH